MGTVGSARSDKGLSDPATAPVSRKRVTESRKRSRSNKERTVAAIGVPSRRGWAAVSGLRGVLNSGQAAVPEQKRAIGLQRPGVDAAVHCFVLPAQVYFAGGIEYPVPSSRAILPALFRVGGNFFAQLHNRRVGF